MLRKNLLFWAVCLLLAGGLFLVISSRSTIGDIKPQLAQEIVAQEVSQDSRNEAAQAGDERMQWWREDRFGMFIHWGLYSIPAGVWQDKQVRRGLGEWIMLHGQIPSADYEPLKEQFNPVAFDADKWVRMAKDAGMGYIAITTKHHEGFCLFDSKFTDYDVMNTPFKRDIIRELSDSCRRHGLKFGVYYSIPDWHHREFPAEHNNSGFHGDPNPNADLEKYLGYMNNQITELLTNYGEIGLVWFDGGASFKGMEQRARLIHAEEIVSTVRSLQPQAIINDRLGIPCDYGTPEQRIPDTGLPGRDWETCMTMNDTWGYRSYDHNWKSSETMIRQLVDCASKGGNYLLNVGPTALGEFPQVSIERLTDIGRWMKINSESIYGTQASPYPAPAWGRYTRKIIDDDTWRLYVHVFDWPGDGKLVVEGLENPSQAQYAFLLADTDRKPLETTTEDNQLVIHLPKRAPDAVVSVIAIDITR